MKTLYYNGTVLTMEHTVADAVLTEDGRIIGVGSLDALKGQCDAQTSMYNLHEKTLMPAFIDAHSHITMAAQIAMYADLTQCFSYKDLVDTLRKYQKDYPDRCTNIIVGFGYDHNVLHEQQHPDKNILDQVTKDVPIFIIHASAHMGVLNSKALELAGITAEFSDPEGGKIGRDDETQEPNGYVEEGAMIQIQMTFGEQMQNDFETSMKQTQQMYLSYGVTTVQDGASSPQTIAGLRHLASKGSLKLDVVSYPVMTEGEPLEGTGGTASKVDYVDHFRIGGYKLILDGSPQGKSAWLSKPYEGEREYRGYPWLKDEVVLACCEKAISDRQQLLVHCNGDAASEQFLNCYEKAIAQCAKKGISVERDLRPVMIHCQTVRKDQLYKMKQLSMMASIFIGHVYYWGDVHRKNLGIERGNKISPVASARRIGLHVSFHQDTPVTKPDMLHSVWCAVNRITRQGVVLGGEERVSVYDALRAVTIDAAYQYHEENEKGSISVGKKADFVILDQNPLAISSENLREIKIETTIKDGQVLYQRV